MYRGGVIIGFIDGTSFLDTVSDTDRRYRYTRLAIARADASFQGGFRWIDIRFGDLDADEWIVRTEFIQNFRTLVRFVYKDIFEC